MGKDPVVIHLVMDTDDAKEPYFRSSRVPAPNTATGSQPASVTASVRHTPMHRTPKPDLGSLEFLIAKVSSNYRQLRAMGRSMGIGRVEPDPDGTWPNLILDAHRRSNSLAEFNSAQLSLFANAQCGYDTVFIPYSQLLPFLAREVAALLADEGDLRQRYADQPSPAHGVPVLTEHALYWLICPACHVRNIPATAGRVARSTCIDCGAILPDGRSGLQGLCEESLLSPRVLVDDILFGTSLGSALATSYIGSAAHIVAAGRVLDSLGRNQRQLLWRPRPVRFSLAELISTRILGGSDSPAADRALRTSLLGRGSMLYSLADGPCSRVASGWSDHWRGQAGFSQECFLPAPDYLNTDSSLTDRVRGSARKLRTNPAMHQR